MGGWTADPWHCGVVLWVGVVVCYTITTGWLRLSVCVWGVHCCLWVWARPCLRLLLVPQSCLLSDTVGEEWSPQEAWKNVKRAFLHPLVHSCHVTGWGSWCATGSGTERNGLVCVRSVFFFFFFLVAIVSFTSYTFIEAAAEQQQLHRGSSKEREDRGDVLSDYGNVLSIAWISGKTISLDYTNQLVNLYSSKNQHLLVLVSKMHKKSVCSGIIKTTFWI